MIRSLLSSFVVAIPVMQYYCTVVHHCWYPCDAVLVLCCATHCPEMFRRFCCSCYYRTDYYIFGHTGRSHKTRLYKSGQCGRSQKARLTCPGGVTSLKRVNVASAVSPDRFARPPASFRKKIEPTTTSRTTGTRA